MTATCWACEQVQLHHLHLEQNEALHGTQENRRKIEAKRFKKKTPRDLGLEDNTVWETVMWLANGSMENLPKG